MLLLKRPKYDKKKPSKKTFTFHYASIKTWSNKILTWADLLFTFHYASIKTGKNIKNNAWVYQFTFHYASIKTPFFCIAVISISWDSVSVYLLFICFRCHAFYPQHFSYIPLNVWISTFYEVLSKSGTFYIITYRH